MKTKTIKKASAIALILAQLFIYQPVHAGLFGGISKSLLGAPSNPMSGGGGGGVEEQIRKGINNFLEDDLNINVEDGLRPMTEGINTADKKAKIPSVSLRFATQNPKPGESVTVTADIQGISNVNDAYYTWFLKRNSNSFDDIDQMHRDAVKAQAAMYYDQDTLRQKFNEGMADKKGDDYDGYIPRMGGDNGIPRVNERTLPDSPIPTSSPDPTDILPFAFGLPSMPDLPSVTSFSDSEDPSDDVIQTSNNTKDFCYIYDAQEGTQYEIGKGGDSENGCPEGYVSRCMIEDNELQCPVDVLGISVNASKLLLFLFKNHFYHNNHLATQHYLEHHLVVHNILFYHPLTK